MQVGSHLTQVAYVGRASLAGVSIQLLACICLLQFRYLLSTKFACRLFSDTITTIGLLTQEEPQLTCETKVKGKGICTLNHCPEMFKKFTRQF